MNRLEAGKALTELARDLRWSWNHAADHLWERLDPALWARSRNAWIVLQSLAHEKLEAAISDREFVESLNQLVRQRSERMAAIRWFRKTWRVPPFNAVAYFSMEFMLGDVLPIYAGGLGNVAGDHLKAANDLGVPVVGMGLLYQQGYFRQHIDAEGRQQAFFPFNDPAQMPITQVRDATGNWLRVALDMPGSRVWVRTWRVVVGTATLYLLDTNDPENLPEYRGITSELYGGGDVLRLRQEQVLGIAGWRLLRILGINPEVCHLNEGHAAFAILERARCYMVDNQQPFGVALAVTRAGNIFTTHTAVDAGFDRFSHELMERHLKDYIEKDLGIPFGEFLALGRAAPNDCVGPFNMAWLAVRGSGAVNGVSRLHGEVSRRIFRELFPRWPEQEVPVGYITNGVHVPSWDSLEADELWTEACGQDRWRHELDHVGELVSRVPSSELWTMRTTQRKALVLYVRERLARQLAGHGASVEEISQAGRVFEPDTLTIGFARRFAEYKRPNLLLRDPDRLLRILVNRQRPVQLILAGKAHPRDTAGQEMLRQWINFIRHTPARSHAVFLSDYDMQLTGRLVQGVDLWLNTPRRPWEACGTSGMKILVNGGLNCSTLDGWWAEAYSAELGWAIGDGHEYQNDAARDAADAEHLYALLENEIIPEFYRRDQSGIPAGWTTRMRESVARLTPHFSSGRSVQEYVRLHYAPAAERFRARAANQSKVGIGIENWQKHIASDWPGMRLGSLKVETNEGKHTFEVQAYLNEISPEAIQIELYAESQSGGQPFRQTMTRCTALVGSDKAFCFRCEFQADRPARDFTPRVIPFHADASIPLEAPQILWWS